MNAAGSTPELAKAPAPAAGPRPDEPAPRPAPTGGARSLTSRLLLAVLLGVVVYGALVMVRGYDKIASELAHYAAWTFLFACGLSFVNYLIRYLKWEYYLAVLGLAKDARGERVVSRSDSLLIFLSGFVLTVTPGKVGEVFKSLVLFETRGVPMARTAPIVVAERLTDLVGIIALITAGGTAFEGGWLWAGAGAAAVSLLLAFVSIPALSRLALAPWPRLPGALGRVAARVVPKVERALVDLRSLTRARHLVVPSLLSIAGWALEGVGAFVILRGFGSDVALLRAAFFYATATLAGALIPVPGGLGVTEKVFEEGLVLGGVPGAIATPSMLLCRIATLWFAVLVGFVALFVLRLRYPRLLGRHEALDPEHRAKLEIPSDDRR